MDRCAHQSLRELFTLNRRLAKAYLLIESLYVAVWFGDLSQTHKAVGNGDDSRYAFRPRRRG
jgi:hypothetical protein